jgi:thiamine biosynthesis lipoprotein
MTLTRRRFLTISAAAACAPHVAQAESWNGHAFGADISIAIRGETAKPALQEARQVIAKIENQFSLYDPHSALVQLNSDGFLKSPDPQFLELMTAADHAYQITNGLFDPTVQRLWQVYAARKKPTEYFFTIGWDRVRFDTDQITLDRNQALTFNGIAQGFATDKVTEVLLAHGLSDVLVNIGEHRSTGGPWKLSLNDPTHGTLATRTLTTGAIATSSPLATDIIRGGHIIHKTRPPQWSTVSVEAASATLADSLSTALVLATREEIETVRKQANVSRITLVDQAGDLTTL